MSDILIHCPECKTKHTVKAEAVGEVFECDSCGCKFQKEKGLRADSILKEKSEEKTGMDLESLDQATVVPADPNFKDHKVKKGIVVISGQPGLLHFIALAVAVVSFLVGFFLIYLGHKPGGFIFEFNNHKRMYFALFLSALSFAGCVYGFKHRWKLGVVVGAGLGTILCGMVVVYKDTFKSEREQLYLSNALEEYSELITAEKEKQEKEKQTDEETPKSYKEKIHYNAFQKVKNNNEEGLVMGIVLYDVDKQYDDDLEDLFIESLGDEAEVELIHSEGLVEGRTALLLILKHKLEQKEKIEKLLKPLVKNWKLDPDLGIYSARLDPLVTRPPFLEEREDLGVLEEFARVSNEILHINRGRQESALVDLTQADQVVYAAFILNNLTLAVRSRDLNFQTDVVIALHHWRSLLEQPEYKSLKIDDFIEAADEAVNQLALTTLKSGVDLPIEIPTYLIDFKVKQAKMSVLEAWKKTPISLERPLTRSKEFAQYVLKRKLSELSKNQLISALSILGEAGNRKILPELEELKKSNNDKKIEDSLRSTIDVIKNRP